MYYQSDGKCRKCPNYPAACVDVDNSALAGYWRADDQFADVHECHFDIHACPGDDDNQATGRDRYCSPQYAGPLCSVCAAEHFMTSDNDCQQCNQSGPSLPTIITGVALVICIALVAVACIKTGVKAKLQRSYKIGKTKGMALIQVCQGASPSYTIALH